MAQQLRRQENLVTVARAYGPMEWALAASFLESANIRVWTFDQAIASVAWDKMIAWGGVSIRVPASQADTASALLDGFSPVRTKGALDKVLVAILVFFLFQVPPPPSGYFHQRALAVSGEKREDTSRDV
ncbi:MAG: hypothetical protein RDA78_14725 [Roseibium sp.]|uniref:hypothetical protein n=1 Tax=Roseibium sp. TaxID=1936156 RepID=UPI003D9C0A96